MKNIEKSWIIRLVDTLTTKTENIINKVSTNKVDYSNGDCDCGCDFNHSWQKHCCLCGSLLKKDK